MRRFTRAADQMTCLGGNVYSCEPLIECYHGDCQLQIKTDKIDIGDMTPKCTMAFIRKTQPVFLDGAMAMTDYTGHEGGVYCPWCLHQFLNVYHPTYVYRTLALCVDCLPEFNSVKKEMILRLWLYRQIMIADLVRMIGIITLNFFLQKNLDAAIGDSIAP